MVFCLDRHPPFREFFAWPIFPPTTRVYVYICVCVYVSVASTIAPPFSGYSFCLKEEREREKGECGATTGARISRFLRLVLLSRFVGRTDRPARPTTYRLFTIERHRDSSRLLFLHFYPRFRCNNGKHWSANSRSNR